MEPSKAPPLKCYYGVEQRLTGASQSFNFCIGQFLDHMIIGTSHPYSAHILPSNVQSSSPSIPNVPRQRLANSRGSFSFRANLNYLPVMQAKQPRASFDAIENRRSSNVSANRPTPSTSSLRSSTSSSPREDGSSQPKHASYPHLTFLELSFQFQTASLDWLMQPCRRGPSCKGYLRSKPGCRH